MDDAGEAIGALIGIALVIAAAVWLIGLILTGLGYLALAVGAVLGLVVAIIGFAPLIASAVVWFAAGAPKLFEANDIELLVGGVLATVQAIGFIVGLWLHDKRPEEEFHRFLSGWLVSGIFLGAVAAVAVMLVGGHQLNLITLQVALYSIFAFIFFFAFSSYFLIDVLPWRDTHPRFNSILAFSASIFLSLTAAVTIYGYPGAKAAAQTVGIRLLEYLAMAMNILFAAMGVWLFRKRRELLKKAGNPNVPV